MENALNELLKAIPANIRAEVYAKLQRCVSEADVLKLCKTYHLPVTEQAANDIAAFLTQPLLINEADLGAIAGGTLASVTGCGCPSAPTRRTCSGGA